MATRTENLARACNRGFEGPATIPAARWALGYVYRKGKGERGVVILISDYIK